MELNSKMASNVNYPLFTNQQIFEMSDNELYRNISDFQNYIRRERKSGRDTKDAEVECAYLLKERDDRNN